MQLITLVSEKPKSCDGCMFENEFLIEAEEVEKAEIQESGIAFKVETECFLTHKCEDAYIHCPLIEISNCISYTSQQEPERGENSGCNSH